MRLSWDRKLWAIEFSTNADNLGDQPKLIGGNWHEANTPRYVGEPSRPVLFTTRALARAWCKEKMAKYSDRDDSCKHWRFRPVRVREVVATI